MGTGEKLDGGLLARLAASDRLASVGRAAAGVAHEVNNPVAFVTLALDLLKDQLAQGRSEQAMALAAEMSAAMVEIKGILADLGAFARDVPRAPVDLGLLASGAIRVASYESSPRPRIEREFEEGVLADVRAPRVAQVLTHLIRNAAQAISEQGTGGDPPRGCVSIRILRDRDRALVDVCDTGPGIDAAVAEHLFEPFFTTRGALGAAGLGLWLSRTIVEEEGGTIAWRSRPEGGTCFTVTLPAPKATRGAEVDEEARASAE